MTSQSCTKAITFTGEEASIITSGDMSKVLPLYTVNNPKENTLLRAVAADLTRDDIRSDLYKTLKKRLLETVKDTSNPGVGIAAPQVGISKRLIIVQRFDKRGKPFRFYANASIIEYSPETEDGPEGCLSVPGVNENVSRSIRVVVKYTDERTLKEKIDTVEGFTSVIFQHEVDHLNGIVFTDKLSEH